MSRPRGRPFPRGVSGNPAGRPKRGAAISEYLRHALAQIVGEDGKTTRAEELARVLIAKAFEGDINAIKVVLERVEGRVPEAPRVQAPAAPMEFTMVFDHPDDDGDNVRDRLARRIHELAARRQSSPPIAED